MKRCVSLLVVVCGLGLLGGCGGEDDALKKKMRELEDELEELKKSKGDSQGDDGAPSKNQAFTIPGLELEMLWCAPGTFTMGSPLSEAGRENDETQHAVTLTKGFWLGKHEVTQAQWESIMGSNPSEFKGAKLPVEMVSWDDVASFCAKLTERERRAGRLPEGYAYQLPTEAQWEYACRAGTRTTWSFGDTANLLHRHANYADKNTDYSWSDKSHDDGYTNTAPVGSYPANAWGFHDLHGNVWELCQDWYGDYSGGPVRDPKGPADGSFRVDRGGSWGDGVRYLRSASRIRGGPGYRLHRLGFRPSLRLVEAE